MMPRLFPLFAAAALIAPLFGTPTPAAADSWDEAATITWECSFGSAPGRAQVRLSVQDESRGRRGPATVVTPAERLSLVGTLDDRRGTFTDPHSNAVILTIDRASGAAKLAPVASGTCRAR